MNGRIWRRVLSGIRSSPGLFMVCSAAVSVAVFLVGAFAWAGLQTGRWSEQLSGGRTVVIYFDQATDKADAQSAANALRARAEVSEVSLVSPEQSDEQMRALVGAALPPLGDVLGWSADVRLQRGAPGDVLEAYARTLPHVDEVDREAPLEARALAVANAAMVLAAVLALLVLAVAVFVVYITLSLALLVRRDEIQIQRIVGATDGFVVLPLVGEAAVAAVFGASAALFGLRLLIRSGAHRYASALSGLGLDAPLPLPWRSSAGLVVVALVVACSGALIASMRHLAAVE